MNGVIIARNVAYVNASTRTLLLEYRFCGDFLLN